MRSWAATPTTACRCPSSSKTPAARRIVTNAGSNGKFLGVLDLDVKDGKVAGFNYRLLPVFANLLPADAAMNELIAKVARALHRETR